MVRKPASRNAIPLNVWRSNVSTVEMLATVLETVLKSAVIGLLAATAGKSIEKALCLSINH